MGVLTSGLLGKVVGSVTDIIKEKVTDTDLQNKLLHELDMAQVKYAHEDAMADVELAKAQIGVNLEQAKNPSLFVAGPRPAALWACVAMMVVALCAGVYAAFQPELEDTASKISGLYMAIVLPPFATLIGARTAEKWKGVARQTHK